MLKEESLKRLEKIRHILLKKAHAWDCKDIEECPKFHSGCWNRLDLRISFLWEASKIAKNAISDKNNMEILSKLKEKAHSLTNIMVHHQDVYREEFVLVETLWHELKEAT